MSAGETFTDSLRRWNRECTGWEPSMSLLQRGADDAADIIEELHALLEEALALFAFGVGAMTENGDRVNQERCIREAGELNKRIADALRKTRGEQVPE